MRIGMIASSYPRHAGDGAGSYVGSLARSLVALGHEVHVVAPYDPAVAAMDLHGVQVHRFRYAPTDALHVAGHGRALEADVRLKALVPLLMPGFALAAASRLLALHRRAPFDLIHGHWAVPGGAIAGWVARKLNLPLVITLHGSDVYITEKNRPYAAAARYGFQRARWVTAVSEDLRQRAVKVGLAASHSCVVPCGVDTALYSTGQGARMRNRFNIPVDTPVIGALGRLVYKKGFHVLLEALPRVLDRFPTACCVIGGDGDLREELQTQARRLGIAEHVLLPGYINWQDTPDYCALCQVLAVPSVVDAQGNVDGLPNVLMEAMASGCAIVASRVAGIPDVVTSGENGLLVTPGDAGELAAALICLLDDALLRAHLGRSARQAMVEHYRWEQIAGRFAELYVDAMEKQS